MQRHTLTQNELRNDYKLFLATRLSTTAQQLVDSPGDAGPQVEFCRRFEMLLYDGVKGRVFRWKTEAHDVWEMLKEISPPHIIREITELKSVKTELGRTRAWIRLTINESCLSNYLILICDPKLLSKHYNPSTILLDTVLMDKVRESVDIVTNNEIKVLFNPDSFDFQDAPSAISLNVPKRHSRNTSPRSRSNSIASSVLGLTSNTDIPGPSQDDPQCSSGEPFIRQCQSNTSIITNDSNISKYSSGLTTVSQLSNIVSSDESLDMERKSALLASNSILTPLENKSLLASPEPLWIVSSKSSESLEAKPCVDTQTQLEVVGEMEDFGHDSQNLESLECQKDRSGTLKNEENIIQEIETSRSGTIETQYYSQSETSGSQDFKSLEETKSEENIPSSNTTVVSPELPSSSPERTITPKEPSTESASSCSELHCSPEHGEMANGGPESAKNLDNSSSSQYTSSSQTSGNTPPDILTSGEALSDNSVAEEILVEEADVRSVEEEFKSLEASADSIAELLTVQEAENGVPPQQGTSGFDNGSGVEDVKVFNKRPMGNSLLRDEEDSPEQDMIPDTPMLCQPLASLSKPLSSIYHDNIFLLENQQTKSMAPLGKIVDDVFDEQCSGRSAESAMSASSIYSSNSGENILLLSNDSVKRESSEVFEEPQSIPVSSRRSSLSPSPPEAEPLSSSLYKLFSRSAPKPNVVDTSKLTELNSAVSDDIPLSPELPVSPSCRRGSLSRAGYLSQGGGYLTGAGQATVKAGVATYESAAAWLSLSKDMLWWLQKRVISQHEHCQCSPPHSPDILNRTGSTSSSLLELCTEQCPCCNAIVIDYNTPGMRPDSETLLSRSCPPFSAGAKDLELFNKSSTRTRNTLSDDSANYFNLDILQNPAPTIQQIQEAIEEEKRLLQCSLDEEEKKTHIDILVKLRLKVQSLEERKNSEPSEEELVVLGHVFTSTTRPSGYCDKCSGPVYQRLSTAVTCNACNIIVHKSCLSEVKRGCALQNSADLQLITEICPDHGLNEQNYSCWDCEENIGYTKSKVHQCDYNGRYYCTTCHKKTLSPVPARILQNWDFKPRPLSAQSLDIFNYLVPKETINLEALNPLLFTIESTLNQIRNYREDFILFRAYFIQCEVAMKDRLLLKLQSRQHFVDSSKLYTIQDLIDIDSGILLKEVQEIHSAFSTHHLECERCSKHKFSCVSCNSAPLIDPFNKGEFSAASCGTCHGVYHRACFNSLEFCQYCSSSLVPS